MATVFEKIAKKLADRRTSAVASFWEIVRMVGDGKEPGTDEVSDALDAAGRTVDDLQAAVEVYQQRRATAAVYRHGPDAARELAKVQATIDVENRKFESARKAHADATRPLHDRKALLQSEVDAADRAAEELPSSCPYPEIRQRMADSYRDREEANAASTRLRAKIQELRGDIANCEAVATERVARSMTKIDGRAEFDQAQSVRKAKLADLEKLYAQSQAQEAAVEKRIIELEEAARIP